MSSEYTSITYIQASFVNYLKWMSLKYIMFKFKNNKNKDF